MAERARSIHVVRSTERTPGPSTPGMDRQQAVAEDGIWAGFVRTEPEMASGWHHHGEHESVIYVLSGSLRFEFGPAGSDIVDAGPGDFVRVPRGLVHRESNGWAEPCELVVVRAGRGESSVNVDGPDPA